MMASWSGPAGMATSAASSGETSHSLRILIIMVNAGFPAPRGSLCPDESCILRVHKLKVSKQPIVLTPLVKTGKLIIKAFIGPFIAIFFITTFVLVLQFFWL